MGNNACCNQPIKPLQGFQKLNYEKILYQTKPLWNHKNHIRTQKKYFYFIESDQEAEQWEEEYEEKQKKLKQEHDIQEEISNTQIDNTCLHEQLQNIAEQLHTSTSDKMAQVSVQLDDDHQIIQQSVSIDHKQDQQHGKQGTEGSWFMGNFLENMNN